MELDSLDGFRAMQYSSYIASLDQTKLLSIAMHVSLQVAIVSTSIFLCLSVAPNKTETSSLSNGETYT